MNVFAKFVAVALLAPLAFMLGANQHRNGSWPFGQSAFTELTRVADDDRKKMRERDQKIAQWTEKLRKGGYLIYLRHANREKWPEVVAFDVYGLINKVADASQSSFKRAVCLTEQGVEEAKMIGQIFQLAKIPRGLIVSSPSCRAKQTASYAFGKFDIVENAILFPDYRDTSQAPQSSDGLVDFLKHVEIKPGTNTVIIGHAGTLEYLEKGVIEGDKSGLMETGFHIIERTSDNKLVIVFTVKSISELALSALNVPIP